MQIDLKGWGMGYVSSFQQHFLLQMVNGVAGGLTGALIDQESKRGVIRGVAAATQSRLNSSPKRTAFNYYCQPSLICIFTIGSRCWVCKVVMNFLEPNILYNFVLYILDI